MRSDPPEVTVKISSEVETLPTRNTNYNIHNNHRKIERLSTKAKNPDIFVKLNIPLSTVQDMSRKTQTYGNPSVCV
jgi:hypothetical protein